MRVIIFKYLLVPYCSCVRVSVNKDFWLIDCQSTQSTIFFELLLSYNIPCPFFFFFIILQTIHSHFPSPFFPLKIPYTQEFVKKKYYNISSSLYYLLSATFPMKAVCIALNLARHN